MNHSKLGAYLAFLFILTEVLNALLGSKLNLNACIWAVCALIAQAQIIEMEAAK